MKRLIAVAALLLSLVAPATVACADGWYRDGAYRSDARHEHRRGCGHVFADHAWIVDVSPTFDRYYHHCASHSVYSRFCGRCRYYGRCWKMQHHPDWRDRWENANWRRVGWRHR